MAQDKVQVLDHLEIERKITRIAHEIYERNYKEKDLVIIGVHDRGAEIASLIAKSLKKISPITIHEMTLKLNKKAPLSDEIRLDGDKDNIRKKVVILVDDVLNSGRTLIHAAQFLLSFEPKSLSVATLVDRFHRKFPIRADFVGVTLSTNLKEHVSVTKTKGKFAAYLE
jgi:pyrimidine operon attenuation protein/uracil phosphoribosyltransferase